MVPTTRATPIARPIFHRLSAPTDADITTLLTRLHRGVRRLLVRRGRLPEDDAGSDPFAAEEPLFAQTVAASLQGRVALGPRAGRCSGASARPPALRRPPHGVPDSKASACTPTWRCRHAAGISWSGCAGTSTRSPVGPGRSSYGSSRTSRVGDGWVAPAELCEGLGHGVRKGPGPRADPPRLPADGRPEPGARRRLAVGGHEPHRAQNGEHLPPVRHRQRRGPPGSDRAPARHIS